MKMLKYHSNGLAPHNDSLEGLGLLNNIITQIEFNSKKKELYIEHLKEKPFYSQGFSGFTITGNTVIKHEKVLKGLLVYRLLITPIIKLSQFLTEFLTGVFQKNWLYNAIVPSVPKPKKSGNTLNGVITPLFQLFPMFHVFLTSAIRKIIELILNYWNNGNFRNIFHQNERISLFGAIFLKSAFLSLYAVFQSFLNLFMVVPVFPNLSTFKIEKELSYEV